MRPVLETPRWWWPTVRVLGAVVVLGIDGVLPPPRWSVGRGPLWDWPEIEAEARAVATGRLDPSKATSTMRRQEATLDLVGTGQIAERLGISHRGVLQRIMRGQMPPPRWQVAGRVVWLWEDLKDFPANLRTTR